MTAPENEAGLLAVTVVPRSPRNRVESLRDGSWRVRITAPPVDGAANAMLLKVLASLLDVPTSRLRIAAGQNSRHKRVSVEGLSPESIDQRLRQAEARQR